MALNLHVVLFATGHSVRNSQFVFLVAVVQVLKIFFQGLVIIFSTSRHNELKRVLEFLQAILVPLYELLFDVSHNDFKFCAVHWKKGILLPGLI